MNLHKEILIKSLAKDSEIITNYFIQNDPHRYTWLSVIDRSEIKKNPDVFYQYVADDIIKMSYHIREYIDNLKK